MHFGPGDEEGNWTSLQAAAQTAPMVTVMGSLYISHRVEIVSVHYQVYKRYGKSCNERPDLPGFPSATYMLQTSSGS